ncbi:VOC family protein [Brevundimonas sp.]|uniref:VOC family protein n=1 Tax=Brevundimonas sp. TaxID=1871086 RepID=UPI002610E59B|nr:VOC family protein [Brevundimonas sp.]
MSDAKVTGLNHLTLAVTDLERSVGFYRDLLGCELRAIWDGGAYLEAGPLWLCLSVDADARGAERRDYTHYAFSVDASQFPLLATRVRSQARLWKDDTSEGASLYFLDPDNHRLELHVGTLATRLEHYQSQSNSRVRIIES